MSKRWRIRGSFSRYTAKAALLSGHIIRLWFSLGREDASEQMNERAEGAWLGGRGEGPLVSDYAGARLEHPRVRVRTHTRCRVFLSIRACTRLCLFFLPVKIDPTFPTFFLFPSSVTVSRVRDCFLIWNVFVEDIDNSISAIEMHFEDSIVNLWIILRWKKIIKIKLSENYCYRII